MGQNIIDKYKSNSAWSGIVKIYSDLFDDIEERNSFIKEVSEIDSFVAAQCITSSFKSDLALENEIIASILYIISSKLTTFKKKMDNILNTDI